MIYFQKYIFDGILWLKIIAEFPENLDLDIDLSSFEEVAIDFSECHIFSGNIMDLFSYFGKHGKDLFVISAPDEIKSILSSTKLKYSIKEYVSFYEAYNSIFEKRISDSGGKENYFKFREKLERCKKIENIYYSLNENILLINIVDELNLENEKFLDSIIDDTRPNSIIFNFFFIEYADSTGLGKLISINKRFGSKFTICCCNNNIMRIFKMVKFDHYLNILPTVGDALEYILKKKYRLSENSRINFKMHTESLTVFFDSEVVETDFEKIEKIISNPNLKHIIFDFSNSIYISSTSLGKIASIYSSFNERLHLINISPSLMRIFKIVKFDKFMKLSSIKEAHIKNADGLFTLLKKDEGYFLTAYPPQGKGNKVDLKSVFEDIKKKNIKSFNKDIIKKVVDQSNRIPYKIEEDKMNLDSLVIQISPDNMKAFLLIDSKLNKKSPATIADLHYKLIKKNIVFGLKKTLMEEIISQKIEDKAILIAEGLSYKKGVPPKISMKFNCNLNGKPLISENGKVNFKEISSFCQVKKDELIASIEPGVKSSPSVNIFGDIKGLEENFKVELKMGKNTYLSDDGKELFSSTDGVIDVLEDNTINVFSILEINKDIDFRTGNIHYNGNVMINGDVKSGFIVEGDHIAINGFVEAGNILSNSGDVNIKDGIMGKNKSKIVLKQGDLYTSKIIDSEVLVNGNIIIDNGIIRNSRVKASGKIIVSGSNGNILGSKIFSGSLIESWNIGSQNSTGTEIYLDNNSYKELNALSKNLSYKLRELDKKRIEFEAALEKQKLNNISDILKDDESVKILNELSKTILERSRVENESKEIESIVIQDKETLEKRLKGLIKKRDSLEQLIPKDFMGIEILEKLLKTSITDRESILSKIESEYMRQRELKELKRNISLLEGITKFRDNAKIIVHGDIFPGIKIIFEDKVISNIVEKKSSVCFVFNENKLFEKPI